MIHLSIRFSRELPSVRDCHLATIAINSCAVVSLPMPRSVSRIHLHPNSEILVLLIFPVNPITTCPPLLIHPCRHRESCPRISHIYYDKPAPSTATHVYDRCSTPVNLP